MSQKKLAKSEIEFLRKLQIKFQSMLKNSIYKMRYYAACPTFFQQSNSTSIVNENIKKKNEWPKWFISCGPEVYIFPSLRPFQCKMKIMPKALKKVQRVQNVPAKHFKILFIRKSI